MLPDKAGEARYVRAHAAEDQPAVVGSDFAGEATCGGAAPCPPRQAALVVAEGELSNSSLPTGPTPWRPPEGACGYAEPTPGVDELPRPPEAVSLHDHGCLQRHASDRKFFLVRVLVLLTFLEILFTGPMEVMSHDRNFFVENIMYARTAWMMPSFTR